MNRICVQWFNRNNKPSAKQNAKSFGVVMFVWFICVRKADKWIYGTRKSKHFRAHGDVVLEIRATRVLEFSRWWPDRMNRTWFHWESSGGDSGLAGWKRFPCRSGQRRKQNKTAKYPEGRAKLNISILSRYVQTHWIFKQNNNKNNKTSRREKIQSKRFVSDPYVSSIESNVVICVWYMRLYCFV